MIRDTTAHRIASDWHGGGGSGLYQLASTGRVTELAEDEVTVLVNYRNKHHPMTKAEQAQLEKLLAYIQANMFRSAQPNWHDVITKAYRS